MKIQKVTYHKKAYIDLLLLADEQENMIDKYLELVGTGDVPSALSFYHRCSFTESHRIKNFFTDNYDLPIFEDGKQLIDMVYLKRRN